MSDKTTKVEIAETVVVIPARYASSRLPGKPLLTLAGKPLIQHVYECACETDIATIVIATDDKRIQSCAKDFGAEVCMTSKDHESGSDRLAEVVMHYGWLDDTIVVNLQGDEPLTPAVCLQQVAVNLQTHIQAGLATLATPITEATEHKNPNAVKVVRDTDDYALYFSRAAIPLQRDQQNDALAVKDFALRHIGIYAYRAAFLKQFAKWQPSPLEQLEKLEQLRALYRGVKIHVDIAQQIPGVGVDTLEDAKEVEAILSKR